MCDSPSSLFFIVCWLDAEILDGRLNHKIFSAYPPPPPSKPDNSGSWAFPDCRSGFHGIHVGVLLCRYLEFSFLPSEEVRHHACLCFPSSQNTLAFPALWSHLLFCPFQLLYCVFGGSFQEGTETDRYNPSWLTSSIVCSSSELRLEMQYWK